MAETNYYFGMTIIRKVRKMIIEDLLDKRNMTKHKLAVAAGVPQAALNDICSGKIKLEKCSAETIYKIANALGVSMEMLTESGLRETKREHSYECGLPDYLPQAGYGGNQSFYRRYPLYQ
ncbi:MAG: helix-turn-helix transcriptional regulator [Lachnospiraceae bacterium]|nr:helix-turn-helix transcriptional regulator [Lachnospiraceae bacterium]